MHMSFDVKAVFPLMGKPDLPIKCVKPVFLKVGEFSPTFALINFSVYNLFLINLYCFPSPVKLWRRVPMRVFFCFFLCRSVYLWHAFRIDDPFFSTIFVCALH